MTSITEREIPDGMQLEWDSKLWNVGFAYRWSDVYECYLELGTLTVKPGQSLPEAWDARYDEPMWPDHEIFFSTGLDAE